MESLAESFGLYRKDPKIANVYGTAGFRMEQSLLPSVMYSCAVLAALRSKSHTGASIAVMITASHNKHSDNGVKITEPDGEMLSSSWEVYATQLANASSFIEFNDTIKVIIAKESILMTNHSALIVGRDTRPSGILFTQIIKNVCDVISTQFTDFGVVTTPQLHHIVRSLNDSSYGVPTLDGYFQKLSAAFNELVANHKPIKINVDCANGVGAVALKSLLPLVPKVKLNLHNTAIENQETLNHDCGADYVKMKQASPAGITIAAEEMWASLDGDADRIVFYYTPSSEFRLLDGDKIAILSLEYITRLVKEAGVDLSIGIIQTAYANGASTEYIKKLGVPVVFTCTGVKHLHHAAKEFDVGVYFEANGHGTILFSPHALKTFSLPYKGRMIQENRALRELYLLSQMINQCVGDALSDLLLILVIISSGVSFSQWDASYSDLPSLQKKVLVSDKNVFIPGEADMKLLEPSHIQTFIDEACKDIKNARCFVRPSGTEDCVRVYTEAETKEQVESISQKVSAKIVEHYLSPELAKKLTPVQLEPSEETITNLVNERLNIELEKIAYEKQLHESQKIEKTKRHIQDLIQRQEVYIMPLPDVECQLAEEQIIECYKRNKGRTLDCWKEVETFKQLLNAKIELV